jgi:hypothetical protein
MVSSVTAPGCAIATAPTDAQTSAGSKTPIAFFIIPLSVSSLGHPYCSPEGDLPAARSACYKTKRFRENRAAPRGAS